MTLLEAVRASLAERSVLQQELAEADSDLEQARDLIDQALGDRVTVQFTKQTEAFHVTEADNVPCGATPPPPARVVPDTWPPTPPVGPPPASPVVASKPVREAPNVDRVLSYLALTPQRTSYISAHLGLARNKKTITPFLQAMAAKGLIVSRGYGLGQRWHVLEKGRRQLLGLETSALEVADWLEIPKGDGAQATDKAGSRPEQAEAVAEPPAEHVATVPASPTSDPPPTPSTAHGGARKAADHPMLGRQIVALLKQVGAQRTGQLAQRFGWSAPVILSVLRSLMEQGLVDRVGDGTDTVYYAAGQKPAPPPATPKPTVIVKTPQPAPWASVKGWSCIGPTFDGNEPCPKKAPTSATTRRCDDCQREWQRRKLAQPSGDLETRRGSSLSN